MSRGLLDTSVVIARSDDPAVASALPDESAISVATLAELHFGTLVFSERAGAPELNALTLQAGNR